MTVVAAVAIVTDLCLELVQETFVVAAAAVVPLITAGSVVGTSRVVVEGARTVVCSVADGRENKVQEALQVERHIVVACCVEHHSHEKTVAEGRGRVVAACAGELEGAASVIAGDGWMKNNWNDVCGGDKGYNPFGPL